jgi:hypothetical protein
MLNDWRYQIGNLRKALSKPAHRRAGQGSDGGYCFD